MKVEVVNYTDAWKSAYEREATAISCILAGNLVEIHHIGSTSVPGLMAKPIIDIMPVVSRLSLVDACNPAFAALGYECMGEFGIPGRRYFRKGGYHRTHQVHIFEVSNQTDIRRHLAVRDYLRAHPGVAQEYGRWKQAIALAHPNDIEGYCDAKAPFMQRLQADALQWYQKTVL